MAWSAVINFTADDDGKVRIIGKTIGASQLEAFNAAEKIGRLLPETRMLLYPRGATIERYGEMVVHSVSFSYQIEDEPVRN